MAEFTESTRLFVTMGLADPVELVAKRLCLGLSLPASDAELRVSEPCEQCREHALELVELLLPWLRAEILAAKPVSPRPCLCNDDDCGDCYGACSFGA